MVLVVNGSLLRFFNGLRLGLSGYAGSLREAGCNKEPRYIIKGGSAEVFVNHRYVKDASWQDYDESKRCH